MKRIIKLLQYQNRSLEDLEELSQLFTKHFSFVHNIQNQLGEEFLKFFKSLKVETHRPMKTLFEAGQIGRKIYFILDGEVAIFLPLTNFKLEQLDTQTQYYTLEDMSKNKYKNFKLIKYLTQGTHFGEVALSNKGVRTASVVVVDTLIVATLSYDMYQQLVHQAQLKINEIQLNYLKGVSLFEGWNDSQLMVIMKNCEFKEYRPFEYVFRCNDKVDYIYFIIQGEIRFSIYKYVIEVDMVRKIQKKLMSISLLSNNQYFGDFEIYQQQQDQDQLQEQVNQLKRYSDAYTQTHCKIYRLQMQQFLDNYSTFSDLNKPKKMFIKLNKHRQSMQEIRTKIIQQKQFVLDPNTITSRKETSNFQIPRRIPTIPIRLKIQGRQNTLDYSTNRSRSNDFFNPERLKNTFGYVTAIANDTESTIINCQRIRLLNSKIQRRNRTYSSRL